MIHVLGYRLLVEPIDHQPHASLVIVPDRFGERQKLARVLQVGSDPEARTKPKGKKGTRKFWSGPIAVRPGDTILMCNESGIDCPNEGRIIGYDDAIALVEGALNERQLKIGQVEERIIGPDRPDQNP